MTYVYTPTSTSPLLYSPTSPISLVKNVSALSPLSTLSPYASPTISPYISPISPLIKVGDTLISSEVYFPSMASPFLTSPLATSPYDKLTINLEQSKPLVSKYDSIDNLPSTIEMMVKYYYFKTLDKWLPDELSALLNYFSYKDGKVEIVKDLSQTKKENKDSDEVIEKKIDYIQQNVFSKSDMKKLLKKFVQKHNTKFSYLPRNEDYLRHYVKKHLKSRIEGLVK